MNDDFEQLQAEMRQRVKIAAGNETVAEVPPFGRHYRVPELAAALRLSRATIKRIFENEDGVIRIGQAGRRRTRRYISLLIPEHVALRVYNRMKNNVTQVSKSRPSPGKGIESTK